MKVIIAGSRTINNYKLLKSAIEDSKFKIDEIVSGVAKGIDTLGLRYAEENKIPVKCFPADWKKFKKKAGLIRNREMAEYADGLIAIWDGYSRGTKHMIDFAASKGLNIFIRVQENK
jgi:hypothetical protein